ncbi:MAG: hypothetical protein GXO07_01510 [Crenarchaeota archaeon]|nr:hypothetical protein [Thermoproteota archaeon]
MSGLECPRAAVTPGGPAEVTCHYVCQAPLSFVRCAQDFCIEDGEVIDAKGKLVKEGDKCVKVQFGSGRGSVVLLLPPGRHEVDGAVVEVHEVKAKVDGVPYYSLPVEVELEDRCPGCERSITVNVYGELVELKPNEKKKVRVVPTIPTIEAGGRQLPAPEPRSAAELLDVQVKVLGRPLKGFPVDVYVKASSPVPMRVVLDIYGQRLEGRAPFEKTVTVVPKRPGGRVCAGTCRELELPEPLSPVEVVGVEGRDGRLKLLLKSRVEGKAELEVEGERHELDLREGLVEAEVGIPKKRVAGPTSIMAVLRVGEAVEGFTVDVEAPGEVRLEVVDGKLYAVGPEGSREVSPDELAKEGIIISGVKPLLLWRRELEPPVASVCVSGSLVAVASRNYGYVLKEDETVSTVEGTGRMSSVSCGDEFFFLNTDGYVYVLGRGRRSVKVGMGFERTLLAEGSCFYACYSKCGKFCRNSKLWEAEVGEALTKPARIANALLVPAGELVALSASSGRKLASFDPGFPVVSVAARRGTIFVGGPGKVALLKLKGKTFVTAWEKEVGLGWNAAMAPDASAVAVLDKRGRSLKFFDLRGEEVTEVKFDAVPSAMDWDGRRLAVGFENGAVMVFRVEEVVSVRSRRSGRGAPPPP